MDGMSSSYHLQVFPKEAYCLKTCEVSPPDPIDGERW